MPIRDNSYKLSDITTTNALEDSDPNIDVLNPFTTPVYDVPGLSSYRDRPNDFTAIDSNYIKNNEKILKEDMVNEKPLNDAIEEYLKLSGVGARVHTLSPEEKVDLYQTRMRNYSTSVGFVDEKLSFDRSRPEDVNAFKTAHDIWDKYPNIFQGRGEGFLGNMAAARENTLNQLNPLESPDNFVPGIAMIKAGTKLGLSVGQKVAGATFLDMLSAYGLDYYDQELQQRMGRQEGYNIYQGYMSLLQGMIGGGIELAMETKALHSFKLFDGVDTLFTKKPKTDKQKDAIIKSMNNKVEDLTDWWIKSTNSGKKLLEEDNIYASDDFIELLMFGNSEKGVKGLVAHMSSDLDLVYYKDIFNPNMTNKGQFMASLTKALDEGLSPQVKGAFTKKLRSLKDVPSLDQIFNKIPDASPPDSFASFLDAMNRKFSKAGKELSIASDISRQVRTTQDVLQSQAKAEVKLAKLLKKSPQPFKYFQQAWKRGVVSTWSTTSLNMAGWTAANLVNLAGDAQHLLAHAALMPLNLAVDMVGFTTGTVNKSRLLESYKSARNIVNNNTFRFATMLEPNATIDAFYELMKIDPTIAKQLRQVIVGGVDVKNVDELAKKFNFTKVRPDGEIVGAPPGWMKGNEAYLGFVQKMGLVTAADLFTKSQSFLGHVDRMLRDKKGYGFAEFVQKDEATLKQMIASQEMFEILGNASEQTLKDIFSKSYKTADSGVPDFLLKSARFIEDFGDIPVLGTFMPFGKFFNNSIAFTYNNLAGGNIRFISEMVKSGGKLSKVDDQVIKDAMKNYGVTFSPPAAALIAYYGLVDKLGAEEQTPTDEDISEGSSLMEKILIGGHKNTALGECIKRDKEKIAKGLTWDTIVINGRERNIRYMFPFSQCAVLARAINVLGEKNINPLAEGEIESSRVDLPNELIKDVVEQMGFSQLGRNLSGIFTFDTIAMRFINKEQTTPSELANAGLSLITNIPAGYSRAAFDPIEKLSAYPLGADNEKLAVVDKKGYEASVYNTARYLTNFQRLLFGGNPKYLQPKKSALNEAPMYASGGWYDILGLKPKDPPTATVLILNQANLQPWTKEFKTKFPHADNFFREQIAPRLEHVSIQLLNSPGWNKLSSEDKKNKFETAYTDVKKKTLDEIIAGTIETEQGMISGGVGRREGERSGYLRRLASLVKIANLNERDLMEALQLYNQKAQREVFNPRLDPKELLKEDNRTIQLILENAKQIKATR